MGSVPAASNLGETLIAGNFGFHPTGFSMVPSLGQNLFDPLR
jgi:hypothetical protein